MALNLLGNALGILDLTLSRPYCPVMMIAAPPSLVFSFLDSFIRHTQKVLSQPHLEFDLKGSCLTYWLGFTPNDVRLVISIF